MAKWHIDGLVQGRRTPLLTHWSYVFLALTHRYVYHRDGKHLVVTGRSCQAVHAQHHWDTFATADELRVTRTTFSLILLLWTFLIFNLSVRSLKLHVTCISIGSNPIRRILIGQSYSTNVDHNLIIRSRNDKSKQFIANEIMIWITDGAV